MVNDGSFFETIQVVYEENLENFKEVQKFRVGSAVTVRGLVVPTPDAKQPFEIKAQEVILEGDCPKYYPIQPKRHTREFLREVAHLTPTHKLIRCGIPCSLFSCSCYPQLLPRAKFRLCSYTNHHGI